MISKVEATIAAVFVALLILSGCLNVSTPPAQITSSQTPARNYTEHTCDQLVDALGTLARDAARPTA